MSVENLLMMGDSERDADMLYAVGMFLPDPFIYLRLRGKCQIVVNDLEFDRARHEARHCRVWSLPECCRKIRQQGISKPTLAHVIRWLLWSKGLRKVSVGENFPVGLARELARLKVSVEVKQGPLFSNREFKCAEEVKKISAALIMAEVGLAEGLQALRSCKIDRKQRLIYHSIPLTSEKLRAVIDTAILQAGGVATHTIVAGGSQACEPHHSGHGILRANEGIILDVFPRSQKTGYYGDITRTVVRGRASEALRKMYHTVQRAQELAFEQMRNDMPADRVHQRVQEFFEQEGYRTNRCNGRMQGFFHGTGHGLGLQVHEAPRVGANSRDTLRAGHVVTVEPGLYYPKIGGVRLEDVALITRNGPRNLTKFEKSLEV